VVGARGGIAVGGGEGASVRGGAGRKEDEALAMPILKWKTMEMK
jgi:hypothetical protein